MKKMETAPLKNTGTWQIFAIGPTGLWTGFKAPLKRLHQFTLLLTVIILVCAISLTGWILSRWRAEELARNLSSERLRVRSLEQELRNPLASQQNTNLRSGQNSMIPSLGAEEIKSSIIEIKNYDISLSTDKKEFSVDFEFTRDKTLENSANYYWMIILHSTKGLLVFPHALSSQKGELLVHKNGEFLENVQDKKTVSAKFTVGDFIRDSGGDKTYASLFIYNNLGSLLVARRKELNVR